MGFRIVRMVGSGGSERSSRMDLRAIRNPALALQPEPAAHHDKLYEPGSKPMSHRTPYRSTS